ncbi:MAG: sodium pump decarboxylase gamma subunit [Clostridia bacterium]|nr:sodium pump decarboxylase gamma subunit [Clostridia bacterium]
MQAIAPAVKIMWQGMAGIFVVMAAIALIVFLFTKIIKK